MRAPKPQVCPPSDSRLPDFLRPPASPTSFGLPFHERNLTPPALPRCESAPPPWCSHCIDFCDFCLGDRSCPVAASAPPESKPGRSAHALLSHERALSRLL